MSCTVTEEVYAHIKKIKFEWATASSSAGTATGTTGNAFTGKLLQVTTIPGTGGAAPSASYDVTIVDQDSADACLGNATSRAAVGTEYVKNASLGAVANDLMTMTVTNAGSSKDGTVIVFVR